MAVRCRTAVVAWQAALFRSHNQTEHQSFSSAASMNGLAPWASCTSLLASLASASSVRLRPMTPTHRLFYGERAPDKTAWDVWYRPQLLRAQPDRLLARLRQGQRFLGQGSNAISAAFPPTAAGSRNLCQYRHPGADHRLRGQSLVPRPRPGFCTSMCSTPAGVSTSNQRPSLPRDCQDRPSGPSFFARLKPRYGNL